MIDLGREELRCEPQDDAPKRLGEGGSVLRELRYSGCGDRTHRVVRGTVNGIPSDMLTDTGAASTTLARNHPALRSMQSTLGQPGSAMGVTSRGDALVVDQVPIGFAETSYVLPAVMLPVSGDCWKGALGADLLRHCTLVWAGARSGRLAGRRSSPPLEQSSPSQSSVSPRCLRAARHQQLWVGASRASTTPDVLETGWPAVCTLRKIR